MGVELPRMNPIPRGASLDVFVDRLRPLLDLSGVTDLVINKQHEAFTYADGWAQHEIDFSTDELHRMALAATVFSNHTAFDESSPILAGVLPPPYGERIQVVRSPATESGCFSVSIRAPTDKLITLDEYSRQGFFHIEDRSGVEVDPLLALYGKSDKRDFIVEAVRLGKVIVLAGPTGSGKTTFMRALLDLIPYDQRIVTIQDTHELPILQPNRVHLFTSEVSASLAVKCAMRMRPDHLIMGEVRGEEAFDLIRGVKSGHGGSFVTVHSSNCKTAFEQLALMVGMSPYGGRLPHGDVCNMLHSAIDVVVHINTNKRMSEVYYKGAENA